MTQMNENVVKKIKLLKSDISVNDNKILAYETKLGAKIVLREESVERAIFANHPDISVLDRARSNYLKVHGT